MNMTLGFKKIVLELKNIKKKNVNILEINKNCTIKLKNLRHLYQSLI